MKKITLIVLSILLFHMQAFAYDAKEASKAIAVVDIQKIMKDADAAKSINDQIEKKRSEYQKQISKQEDGLKKEHDDINKQQAVLAKDALENKMKDFNNKVASVQKDIQEKRVSLDEAFSNALGEVQNSLYNIIEEMSKEKQFVMAIPSSQILYAKDDMDITDEVLKRLNKKLPKVELKVQAAKKK